MEDNNVLDLRGLKCPLPALLAKKALANAPSGTLMTVLADDPLAAVDIPHMCHGEGHAVDGVTETGSHTRFSIRCGPAPAAGSRPPTGG
jgi:tRNA 2-thiouridine synthesizing protein A